MQVIGHLVMRNRKYFLLSLCMLSFSVLATAMTSDSLSQGDTLVSDSAASWSHWDVHGIALHTAFCALPAQEIYNSWDQTDIHPYDFDIGDFNDTICLALLSEGACGYTHPVEGQVTSGFGYRRYRWHFGTDIDLHTGDPVYAAFDGVVRVARYSPSYGYVIVIRHYNGLETLYAHLSRLLVKAGEEVPSGTKIGLGGNTGRSSGSHLHFEVRYKGWSIDPQRLIDFDLGQLRFISAEFHAGWMDYMPAVSGPYYTIVRGDTLYGIARRHGISLQKLLALNHLTKNALIVPGQKIRVQ